ncbi:MAG: hypothetical protein QM736_13275 [Vicinamibacterales bacterium]
MRRANPFDDRLDIVLARCIRFDDVRFGCAGVGERTSDRVRIGRSPLVGDRDVCAAPAEGQRRRQPDPARAAGDEHRSPLVVVPHRRHR